MESQIEAESKRKTNLARELCWQKFEVERDYEYSWENALDDVFQLAQENSEHDIKRQCLRLYKSLGLLTEVNPDNYSLFGGPRSKFFFKLDNRWYSLREVS